jgi:hypothetical protein
MIADETGHWHELALDGVKVKRKRNTHYWVLGELEIGE